jgi:DNA-directed RNA polymerase subunit N (RpoN/RPB10)
MGKCEHSYQLVCYKCGHTIALADDTCEECEGTGWLDNDAPAWRCPKCHPVRPPCVVCGKDICDCIAQYKPKVAQHRQAVDRGGLYLAHLQAEAIVMV